MKPDKQIAISDTCPSKTEHHIKCFPWICTGHWDLVSCNHMLDNIYAKKRCGDINLCRVIWLSWDTKRNIKVGVEFDFILNIHEQFLEL